MAVRHRRGRRRAVGQARGQRRRRPLVPAGRRRAGPRLPRRRQPGAVPGHEGSTRTARAGPGPNLYTNSLVALDGRTGKLLWYRQAVPHDLRDYDLAISPILTRLPRRRRRHERRHHGRQDGQGLRLPRGRRQAALGRRPSAGTRTTRGRCRTSTSRSIPARSAASRRRWRSPAGASSCRGSTSRRRRARPRRTARIRCARAAAGSRRSTRRRARVLWQHRLPSMAFGAATVANDVVFTSTYDGTIYAFATATGKRLWKAQGARGHQLVPRDRRRHAARRRGRARLLRAPALRADRLRARADRR